ncbi:MAG: geranylgeranylglyceryl/heptaprenylglyceryl phosphate synthase, partial [Candidatus Hydrothermarchaeaceae archaeon]
MNVLQYLETELSKRALHLTLIDPDKQSAAAAAEIAFGAYKGGTDGIMAGGSTGISSENLDEAVKKIKEKVELPVILFPGGVAGISKHADAIFFMSLLNSR